MLDLPDENWENSHNGGIERHAAWVCPISCAFELGAATVSSLMSCCLRMFLHPEAFCS